VRREYCNARERMNSVLDFSLPLFSAELPAPLMWLVLIWLFAAGACIGSFMNVVIYRLPAGLSLLHPPSRCPSCERPIRATDNVPIFGWLWLGGRCRNCRAPISPRYPAVELVVALLFVGLAWVEPISRGSNQPSPPSIPAAELWGIYAYHLFLLCSLICAAFTEFDGQRLTTRLVLPPLVVGLIAPLVWPHLRPLTTLAPAATLIPPPFAGVVGVIAGLVIGLAIAAFDQRRQTTLATQQIAAPPSIFDFGIALAWVGAFLGWQAAIALAAVAGMTRLVLALAGRILPIFRRIGLMACLALWTWVWILAWRAMVEELL
jgi:leader peptidase (prepilin peptidase)/N-methyltransferase